MSVRARIRVGQAAGETYTVTMDPRDVGNTTFQFPCKEWCISDDVLNVADSASMSIANVDGENSGKVVVGQKISFDLSDSDVQGGAWLPQFVGRVTQTQSYTDLTGGSCILVSAMDLGWHLTQCHGPTHKNLQGLTWQALLDLLIDPSWGINGVVGDNTLNRKIKQGRVGVQRSLLGQTAQLTSILPYIQVEIGQCPWDILQQYAQREGVLLNVGQDGSLIFFRPDYSQPASYALEFHPVSDQRSASNNVVGRPAVTETIDGYYSKIECWSTVVNPQKVANPEDPNAQFTRETYTPASSPLPFNRLMAFMDSESITSQMGQNRATWKYQQGAFESWQYEAEFRGVSQRGTLYSSDSIMSINDSHNDVTGGYYVQRVQKSATLQDGLRTKVVLRKPGLLNPRLTTFDLGGGTKPAASPRTVKQ